MGRTTFENTSVTAQAIMTSLRVRFKTWATCHERLHPRSSSPMEISFCFHPIYVNMIAMKFCIWHDNCAVVPCAEFCIDMISYNRVTLRPIFNQIWITRGNCSRNMPLLYLLAKSNCPIVSQVVPCSSMNLADEIHVFVSVFQSNQLCLVGCFYFITCPMTVGYIHTKNKTYYPAEYTPW